MKSRTFDMEKKKVSIGRVIRHLEDIAPPVYQAGYDNTGLQVGDPSLWVKGILIALDATEEVVAEAIGRGCNLLITHHPLIFRPLKQLAGQNMSARCLAYAIKHDLAIYSLHTSLDYMHDGLNHMLGRQLGLVQCSLLAPLSDTHSLLTLFLPHAALTRVREALEEVGAGRIESYSGCSFAIDGKATFRPSSSATSHIGSRDRVEEVEEVCLQMVIPLHSQEKVAATLAATHPYGRPVYYMQLLAPPLKMVGAGMVGELPSAYAPKAFLHYVKERLSLSHIRYTQSRKKKIKKVAFCGGAGAGLWQKAEKAGVDAFLTADLKYHDFFDVSKELMLIDIGHYESEVCFKVLIYTLLTQKFPNIASYKCTTCTNPIHYE